MMNVNALSRRFEPLITFHCAIANILHVVDIKNRPDAYDEHAFIRDGQTKVKIRESDNKIILPVIIKSTVDNEKYVPCTENMIIKHLSPPLIISSCPVLVTFTHQPMNTGNSSKETLFRMLDIQESLSINCFCGLTTYVGLCSNGVNITRFEIFNGIRVPYLQEDIIPYSFNH